MYVLSDSISVKLCIVGTNPCISFPVDKNPNENHIRYSTLVLYIEQKLAYKYEEKRTPLKFALEKREENKDLIFNIG